ncbi:MAG: PEP-CTERM system histidine kinase PrsK [Betaproteobacteria bacterium]|nr:PEP-CTERM system histidine kinase PrsK [Betaproteobacteria bacterium]
MSTEAANISIFGFAIATLLHAIFAVLLLRDARFHTQQRERDFAFVGAVLASFAWSAAALADALLPYLATRHVAMALDWLRYGCWLLFLVVLVRPATARSLPAHLGDLPAAARRLGPLAWSTGVLWLAGAGLLAAYVFSSSGLEAARLQRLWLLSALGMPVLGLVLVEQLFRNLPENLRWNAKPACLGFATVFLFDLYHYSMAVLFGGFDPDAGHVRGLVHALALPLIFVASRRRIDWIGRLQVSRTAVFYSASLLLAGAYLLFVAALGYAVRALGGDWGRAMQLALVSGAAIFGLVLLLSGSIRARVRVFVGKHFFSYRYDYREQWLRFTNMLSSPTDTQDFGVLAVRGLADMLESPGGGLWTRNAAHTAFSQTARWNLAAAQTVEPADADLPQYLQRSGWIVDLDEYRHTPQRYRALILPPWLLQLPTAWLVVPLIVHEDLLGFVLLARPRAPVQMNWETRDLVKTASRQAASFLAQMQATEALLELRKFESFNRMSAFVVHDLKNIVTQLSLMLKNAERLRANPEFQQDMLLTVQSSLEKMRRLMLQLREGATPPGTAAGVDLAPLLLRLQAMASDRGRTLELRQESSLATRGLEERLERVLGHLVHNALDATEQGGEVWVAARRQSGQVVVEVGDTGVGMTEEFVQNRLFRPFTSTKGAGMGIGTHESLQYIRELGGRIDVQSQLGKGTVMRVELPLFNAHDLESEPAALRARTVA